jgi:AcrR family transcriptional regulator
MARKPAEQTVNREAILLAAAQVFHEKGYHRTKMEDIARAVDLTAGSLYHHFRNGKQEILIAVLTYGLDEISRSIEAILDSPASYEEKFCQAVRLHVTGITNHVSVGAAMVFEIRTMLDIPEVRETYVLRRDRFEGMFRQLIHDGIQHGEFKALDAKLFVRMMLGSHNWVGVWYRSGGTLTGEAIADQMAAWFLAALKK